MHADRDIPLLFQSVCSEIHEMHCLILLRAVWSPSNFVIFFSKTFPMLQWVSCFDFYTISFYCVFLQEYRLLSLAVIHDIFLTDLKAKVYLLKYCFKLLETPCLWHVLICNFAHSEWTWVNAPRFTTWHCGLIMSWPASQKITTMTLM